MADDACNCGGDGDERNTDAETDSGEWLAEPRVLDASLPRGLRAALGRFLGVGSVDTLGKWAAGVREHVDGDSVSRAELCLTEERTGHVGVVDGQPSHFACFYDAVILAALEDRPVDVRTKSPDGTVVEARAVGTEDLQVSPEGAVFSFGIDRDVEPPSTGGPSLERGYAAICPYVRAFPTREAYERWASTVDAETVAIPLSGATELASVLVE